MAVRDTESITVVQPSIKDDPYGQNDLKHFGTNFPEKILVTTFQTPAGRIELWNVRAVPGSSWAEDSLRRLERTRFADMADEIRPVLIDGIDSMDGPFEPVLARIDHDPGNLLLAPNTGTITGMIDWAFTLSVPPAYDLVCVESNLTKGPWSVHPTTPDRHSLVRTALHQGYQEQGQSAVVDRVAKHGEWYELLARVKSMNHLDLATEMVMPDATQAQVEASARRIVRSSLTT